ncbi:MAG: ABC transporter ATP-binding protein [Phycisphaerales bacterium]
MIATDTPPSVERPLLIHTEGVSRIYRLRGETIYAVRDVSIDIYSGEYLSIMGRSGSGKTTLFNMIGALDRPSEGTVRIGPMDLTTLTSRQLAYVRCHYIGYIFQAYNLVPALTALRNVALPAIFTGISTEHAEQAAAKVLERVGLSHRLDHRPDQLSGGQQQRVAIARALVNDPVILLADEPTANLDFKTGEEIIALLKSLSVEQGVTIITATHDHKMLADSDRVIWMHDGRVDRVSKREDLRIEEGSMNGN